MVWLLRVILEPSVLVDLALSSLQLQLLKLELMPHSRQWSRLSKQLPLLDRCAQHLLVDSIGAVERSRDIADADTELHLLWVEQIAVLSVEELSAENAQLGTTMNIGDVQAMIIRRELDIMLYLPVDNSLHRNQAIQLRLGI